VTVGGGRKEENVFWPPDVDQALVKWHRVTVGGGRKEENVFWPPDAI
jgi:hypothetical protein